MLTLLGVIGCPMLGIMVLSRLTLGVTGTLGGGAGNLNTLRFSMLFSPLSFRVTSQFSGGGRGDAGAGEKRRVGPEITEVRSGDGRWKLRLSL
jgi:hypothetical protein